VYAPEVIASREAYLFDHSPTLRQQYPDGLPTCSIEDSAAQTAQILSTRAEDGTEIRPLTEEEWRFVYETRLRCGIDFPYFARRFVWIDAEGHGLRPLYPLWESQEYLLEMLAKLERQRVRDKSPDGLLLNILKIRQVGITTLGRVCSKR